jgi:hypothetical protein
VKRLLIHLFICAACLAVGFVAGVLRGFPQRAFHEALWMGDLFRVRLAMALGATLDGRLYLYGETIRDDYMIRAAYSGNEELMKFLVSRGGNVNEKDKFGWTPLAIAAGQADNHMVDYLLSVGAHPEVTAQDFPSTIPELIDWKRTVIMGAINKKKHDLGLQ